MESGQLVSLATVLNIMAKDMIKRLSGSKGFFIYGYSREVAQGKEFQKVIAPCKHILYFTQREYSHTNNQSERNLHLYNFICPTLKIIKYLFKKPYQDQSRSPVIIIIQSTNRR